MSVSGLEILKKLDQVYKMNINDLDDKLLKLKQLKEVAQMQRKELEEKFKKEIEELIISNLDQQNIIKQEFN